MTRYRTRKKAKIFLWDYQGDLYILYLTFHCGSELQTSEPVSCTGIEKIGIFSEKIGFFSNKKNCPKFSSQFFDIMCVLLCPIYGMKE